MNEDLLSVIPTNDLFDMMIKSSNELLAIDCRENNDQFVIKREELQIIQRVIVSRRAEFKPVDLP